LGLISASGVRSITEMSEMGRIRELLEDHAFGLIMSATIMASFLILGIGMWGIARENKILLYRNATILEVTPSGWTHPAYLKIRTQDGLIFVVDIPTPRDCAIPINRTVNIYKSGRVEVIE